MVAALLATQLLAAAQPAISADLTETQAQRMGAFAGLRLRVPLDAETGRQPIRVGLTVAPTLHTQSQSGELRTRYGQGLELGIAGGEPVRLSFAGTPVSRLAQGPAGPEGQKAGVSTIGWVAIGVGVVAVTLFALYGLCGSGEICSTDDD